MPNYTFHTDPGHGWLEVGRLELTQLDIATKVSECSFQNGNRVFLEEDCDAPLFTEACTKANIPFNITVLDNDDTPIRKYRRYQRPTI